MDVDISDPDAGQLVFLNKFSDLFIRGDIYLRQIEKNRNVGFPTAQISQGHFPNHEGMRENLALI